MKKKLFFFASLLTAAAATLGLTSCSNEMTPDQPIREGMVDVVMTTSLPQELQSYATTSAEGGLKNLEGVDGLAVRYIMEIYPKGSETAVQRMITYKNLTADGDYRTASFSTRLLAAEYNFVFWADIVKEASSIPYNQQLEGLTAPFYGNSYFFSNKSASGEALEVLYRPTDVNVSEKGDLKIVKASSVGASVKPVSSEMYDGYTCTEAVDLRVESTTHSFTLKRPFAKLRVISTDEAKDLIVAPDWEKSLLKIGTDNTIPNQFNALTGVATKEGNLGGYWSTYYVTSGTYDSNTDNEHTIGVFYLPVSTSSYNLSFSMGIKPNTGGDFTYSDLSVENVPLVANKLTTIKGKILSKKADVTITIDDEFEDDETIIDLTEHEVSSVDDLKNALTGKDQRVTFTSKVTKADGFELDFTNVARTNPVYAEGNNATLTLAFASIEDGAVLTFKGTNAPKNLRIKTGTKCSLRIDLASSDVYYDGTSYKYIVTNSGCAGRKDGLQYDVLFGAAPGDRFSPASYTNAHQFKINADFTLPSDLKCVFVSRHENKTCAFIETLQSWLSSNSGKTVWDFVGDTNN